MARFDYTAIEGRTGREERGSIEGDTANAVVIELKARGLHPTAVDPASDAAEGSAGGAGAAQQADRAGWRWARRRALTVRERMLFTRQLAALVRAGLPLLRGLEVLAKQQRGSAAGPMANRLADTIRAGGSLSDALGRDPRTFDRIYVNLVRAGESAGALAEILDRLASFHEKAERTRRKVKAALAYPAFVLGLATAIVAGLTVFVVPRFRAIFDGVLRGQRLPPLTEGVLAVTAFVREHALTIGVAVGAGWLVLALMRRSGVGARSWDRWVLALPVIGSIESRASAARCARTLGTLVGSGVPILEALSITRESVRNRVIAAAIDDARERVRRGDALARSFEATGRIPPMVTSLVQVGEETGRLAEMLERAADLCDDDVDQAVATMTSLLEPLMIVVMALVVGTIVVALFLPIIQIVQSLS